MFGLKGYSLFNFLNFICNIIYTVERDTCPCRHLIMVMKVGAWRKVDFFFFFYSYICREGGELGKERGLLFDVKLHNYIGT